MENRGDKLQDVQSDVSTQKDLRHNFKVTVAEGAAYSLMYGLTGSFIGVLALKMGASPFQLSLITALPNLVNVLLMVPVASLLERRANKVPYLTVGVFFNRIGYFFLGLAAFMGLPPSVLLTVLTLMTIPAVVAGLAYTDIVANCFPPRERGRVFGAKNAVVGLLTFICTIVAGSILDKIAYPYNYFYVFGIASIFGLIDTYIMSRHRVQPATQVAKKEDQEPYLIKLKNIFGHPTLGKEFQKFLITIAIVYVGLTIPNAIWTIFYVEEMQLSQFQIGNMTAISNAVMVVSSFFWGRKSQRSGDRVVFSISLLGITLVPLWAALASSVTSLYLMQALNGVSMAAYNIAYFNILLSSSEEKYRPTATALFHVLIGLTGVVFPTVGVWLFKFFTERQIFFLAGVIRVAATLVAFKGITKAEFKSLFDRSKDLSA